MPTLATKANMQIANDIHGRRVVALSLVDPFYECSADPHDYWDMSADVALTDLDGETMILAVRVTHYQDALTGEEL